MRSLLPSPVTPTQRDPSPALVSLIISPAILPLILTFASPPTLYSCLRVSRSVSHMAGSILYRDVNLLDILPSSVLNPYACPALLDTRTQYLGYIRTLRMPQCMLFDHELCAALISRMERLRTVVVPQCWPGWFRPLRPQQRPKLDLSRDLNLGLDHDHAPPESRMHLQLKGQGLKLIVTGVTSPDQHISPRLLQSGWLNQAQEIVLLIDHFRTEYRLCTRTDSGEKTPALPSVHVDDGPRYTSGLPPTVKRRTILIRSASVPAHALDFDPDSLFGEDTAVPLHLSEWQSVHYWDIQQIRAQ